MKRQLVLISIALIGGAGAGWVSASMSSGAEAPLTEAPAFTASHNGAAARAAAERLQTLVFVVPPVVESVVEAPPPPDIADLFRAALSAIEQTPGGPVAVIVDLNQESGHRRLKRGDVYQDGWRIAALGRQYIDLRRGAERRRVDLYAPPPETSP
jgi:hypothetical protein